MTPNDLAQQLTPHVQEAAERAKDDILSQLQPVKRVFVKAMWPIAMKDGVPAANRIIIELLIAKYRADIEPMIGDMINLLLKSIDEEKVPQLKLLRDILDVLHTPTTEFHPAVQQCLDPGLVHEVPHYTDE